MGRDISDIVKIYGILHAKRRSPQDKHRFLSGITGDMSSLGFKISTLLQTPSKTVNDLIIGDIQQAKLIIASFYDTPNYLPGLLYHHLPFHRRKTEAYAERAKMGWLFLSACVAFPAAALTAVSIWKEYSQLSTFLFAILTALGGISLVIALTGVENRWNFATNNLAAAVSVRTAEILPPELREQVAFVFLDGNFDKNTGEFLFYRQFSNLCPQKHAVFLEAVGTGGNLFVAGDTQAHVRQFLDCCHQEASPPEHYQAAYLAESQSAQWASCVKLATGNRVGSEIVTPHSRTGKDTEHNYSQIADTAQLLAEYAARLCSKQDC